VGVRRHCERSAVGGPRLLIMDAGWGSTQLIYWPEAGEPARHSFRMGAVRLLERFPPSDPSQPEELRQCREWLEAYLREHTPKALAPRWAEQPGKSPCFVGTGGASSLLASMHLGLLAFDREKHESVELTASQVTARLEWIWGLSLTDRKAVPGLPGNKADIILMGVAIHEAVMKCFEVPSMRVSTRGFRFAALMET
jgi:exopolyphosphatase / guanosine-5'-triphosphate,3'-diphosphate pyrophosphatase